MWRRGELDLKGSEWIERNGRKKGAFMGRFLSYFCVFPLYLFFFLFVGGYLKPLFFSDIATILFSSGVFSRDCGYQNILTFSLFVNFLKLPFLKFSTFQTGQLSLPLFLFTSSKKNFFLYFYM